MNGNRCGLPRPHTASHLPPQCPALVLPRMLSTTPTHQPLTRKTHSPRQHPARPELAFSLLSSPPHQPPQERTPPSAPIRVPCPHPHSGPCADASLSAPEFPLCPPQLTPPGSPGAAASQTSSATLALPHAPRSPGCPPGALRPAWGASEHNPQGTPAQPKQIQVRGKRLPTHVLLFPAVPSGRVPSGAPPPTRLMDL